MGISLFKVSSSCSCPPPSGRCSCEASQPTGAPNPNPFNFKVLRTKEWDYHLVAEVVYPDCTTFEGKKILVLTGMSAEALREHVTKLDPHFSEKGRIIARFRPDLWDMACAFVGSLYGYGY